MTPTLVHGSMNLKKKANSPRLRSTRDRLKPSNPTISPATNAISLRGLVVGPTPSDLPGGLVLSGPEVVPANLSVPQANALPSVIRATFGPFGSASSPSAVLQQSLANRLQAGLDINGSQEYALTWKQQVMLSGPPICALRARGRRTLGSVFTGELAGWLTPSANEDAAGLPGVKMQSMLGSQVKLAISGLATPAFPAAMAKPGVLNPEHSRWLMGFPVEWASCGATAMRLCRKSRRRSSKPSEKA